MSSDEIEELKALGISRLATAVAPREDESQLRRSPFDDGITEEAPTPPDRAMVDGGEWQPGGTAAADAPPAPPSSDAAADAPAPETKAEPPALQDPQSHVAPPAPPREISAEEQARGAKAIGVAVAMVVTSSIEAAKRLAIHQRLPPPLVPLVLSCDEGRSAAIASVVTAAFASVVTKYAGGVVRYTDEAIVVAAVVACAAAQAAARKLPPQTDAERAQLAEVAAAIAAAEAAARR